MKAEHTLSAQQTGFATPTVLKNNAVSTALRSIA